MRPGRVAGGAAVLAGAVAFVLAGVSTVPTLTGGAGLLVLTAGVVRWRRWLVTLGCTGLAAAVLVAAVGGVGRFTVVGGAAAVVAAWTTGQTATELATAFAAESRTRRLEYTHVAGTTAIVGAGSGLALLPGGLTVSPSPVGVVLLVGGAVLVTAGIALSDR